MTGPLLALLTACAFPEPAEGAADPVLQLSGLRLFAEAQASDDLPLRVEAARSTWDVTARVAHFEGDVTASRGPLSLSCQQLEARYDTDGRLVVALAQGEVEVNRAEWRATASKAEFRVGDGAVVLTGAPRVTNGAHTLEGDRIRLYVAREAVDCDGCTLVVDAAGLQAP